MEALFSGDLGDGLQPIELRKTSDLLSMKRREQRYADKNDSENVAH